MVFKIGELPDENHDAIFHDFFVRGLKSKTERSLESGQVKLCRVSAY